MKLHAGRKHLQSNVSIFKKVNNASAFQLDPRRSIFVLTPPAAERQR
jgi:hypothetical protein